MLPAVADWLPPHFFIQVIANKVLKAAAGETYTSPAPPTKMAR